jgi:hypothetical protein
MINSVLSVQFVYDTSQNMQIIYCSLLYNSRNNTVRTLIFHCKIENKLMTPCVCHIFYTCMCETPNLCCRVIFEKVGVPVLAFHGIRSSLKPCWHEPTTCPSPEKNYSSSHFPILFLRSFLKLFSHIHVGHKSDHFPLVFFNFECVHPIVFILMYWTYLLPSTQQTIGYNGFTTTCFDSYKSSSGYVQNLLVLAVLLLTVSCPGGCRSVWSGGWPYTDMNKNLKT